MPAAAEELAEAGDDGSRAGSGVAPRASGQHSEEEIAALAEIVGHGATVPPATRTLGNTSCGPVCCSGSPEACCPSVDWLLTGHAPAVPRELAGV
jgi:hypothetical protein